MKRISGYKSYLSNPDLNKSAVPKQTKFSIRAKKLKTQLNDQEHLQSENLESNTNVLHDHIEEEMDKFSDMADDYDFDVSSTSGSVDDESDNLSENENRGKDALFHNSQIDESESALLIYTFILRHRISKSAIPDLLKLIKLHMPSDSVLPSTRFRLMHKINFDYSLSSTHYYCKKCQNYMSEDALQCDKCKSTYQKEDLIQQNAFFISFSPLRTIEKCLNNTDVNENIAKNFQIRSNNTENMISNIFDGECYKKLGLGYYDLTCNLNSDGVPIFKSSKVSLWPILCTINELDYVLGRRNVLCLGIWFGNDKPNFSCFLKPLKEKIVSLANVGIQWNCQNVSVVSKVYFPMLVADSVARPMLQGLKQFNGSFGCTWCLTEGKNLQSLDNIRSHKWIYPPVKANEIVLRTHTQFIDHLKEFKEQLQLKKVKSYFGIKSPPFLLLVPKFDIINGFLFDYMHTGLLGITRTITNAWLDSKYHLKPFYLGKYVQEIDRRLLKCLVPQYFDRAVRSIVHRKFWKANEWRTWSFISTVILETILDSQYLNHFQKYIKAIMILCSKTISCNNLNYAENLLYEFVSETKHLYGETFCTYNMHLLLHAAQCVRNWGPLHLYSAFAFENFNGVMLNLFKGAYKVPIQISNSIQELSQLAELSQKILHNGVAKDFFVNIFNQKLKSQSLYADQILLLGKSKPLLLNSAETKLLEKLTGKKACNLFHFDSCIVKKSVFTVNDRSTSKRCNSIVNHDKKIYVLQKLILTSENYVFAAISKVKLMDDNVNTDNTNVYFVKEISTRVKLVPCHELMCSQYIVLCKTDNSINCLFVCLSLKSLLHQ